MKLTNQGRMLPTRRRPHHHRQVGRPRVENAREKVITVRLLAAEQSALKRLADQSGVPMSVLVRNLIRRAIKLPTL